MHHYYQANHNRNKVKQISNHKINNNESNQSQQKQNSKNVSQTSNHQIKTQITQNTNNITKENQQHN